jgi:hypothetical protein
MGIPLISPWSFPPGKLGLTPLPCRAFSAGEGDPVAEDTFYNTVFLKSIQGVKREWAEGQFGSVPKTRRIFVA